MRFLYCSFAIVVLTLALGCGMFVHAQVNPQYDTPLARPGFGPMPSPSGIRVVTTSDGFDNFDFGIDFAEPHMSSNPLNPLWHFNAYNVTSSLGSNSHNTINGLDWTTTNPVWGDNMRGDPVTAYDSLGNLYFEQMYGSSIAGCKVVRSTDNGATWSTPVISVAGVDKNWIAADQTRGPYANNVYTTMTSGTTGQGNFARSTNFGATWQTTFTPSTQALPGMMVCVGPNVLGSNNVSGGAVYVVTNSGSSFSSTFTFYASTDGGATFALKSSQGFANYVGTNVGGRNSIQNFRTRPYPFIAADNSFGPFRGRLYLVYASNFPAGNGNKPDIDCRYSTDQGTSWSTPVTINDDPNSTANHQWHPSIWADKETGRLWVKWLDTRNTSTSDSAEVYASYSTNGGVSWVTNQRISNQKFKINCTTCGGGGTPAYLGDYDAITSNAQGSLMAWTDFRNNNFGNYVAYFPDYAMLASVVRDTLRFTDSTTSVVKVPVVKLYSNSVKFTASVSPSAPFVFTWQGRDSITSFPDSVSLKIKTNNVPEGNYVVSIIGRGPNGTPVHRRNIPIRVQLIPNSVRVVQPNGGEIWVQGQSKQIKWRKAGDVNNIRIEYSTNNGSMWTTVTASVPSATGLYAWTVPATPSTQGRVRLSWIDSLATINDQSDAAFTISAPTSLISTTPDSLRATMPYGNNTAFDTLRIANNGTLTLTWSATGTTWANALPTSGSVPADSQRPAPVRFNANGLLGGNYLGNLTVTSNDAFHSPSTIPMRLTVVGVAGISVTPRDTLRFGSVRVGRKDTMLVKMRSIGTDTLRATVNVNPPFRFATLTPTIKLAPNDSTNILVTFNPLDSTASYSATLRIYTNDPDPINDTVFVALTGRGAGTTSVQLTANDVIPEKFSLEQNYPNPFNPSTTIRFGIPSSATTADVSTLKIFDMLGREISTLVSEKLAPGFYSARFETAGLSSGVYFYRLTSGKFVETKKMILEK